jgi:hypothetical protein
MPAAVVFIGVIAVETGVAAVIGSALVGAVTTATVSTAVATAIGSGVISAGLSVAQGASVSQALKSAVVGGVTSYIGASIAGEVTKSVATAATEAGYTSIAANIGKVAGAMAGGGTQAALGSVITGKGDPLQMLIKGGLTAGLTSGVMQSVNEVTSKIPGFSDLAKDYGAAGAATQRAVNAGLAAGVLGKDTDKAVVNSVLSSMLGVGKDYLKEGLKDVSSTLQTAYNNATKTGEALESNIKRQDEIVKDYNSSAEAIEAKRAAIQANLDKYNELKAGYDRGEVAVEEVNRYANLVNDAIPGYDAERATVETKLATLSTELDGLKTQLPTLEQTLVQQKTALDTSVADFQKQEEANAQLVAKAFNDTVAAKTEVEQALGTTLNQEQLDALVKTGDVAAAAQDYIDIKTTDLAEAQAAALREGYRFDPNDPEIAAQFLGVKDEAETLAALQSFADARATTVQEATDLYTQTYAEIYGPDADIPAPTSEDLLAFMPSVPTDVSSIPDDYKNVAEDVVRGRIQDQFSQDVGFEDYADRTYAQESLGEDRPDAETWGQFKGTSGVVGMEDSDIAPVQFAPTNKALAFLPQTQDADFAEQATEDQQVATNEQTADQFGFDQAEFQLPDDQFGFDQTSSDMVGPPTPADFGVGVADAAETPEFGFDTAGMGEVTADIPGAQTAAVEAPVIAATDLPQLEAGADLSGTELSTAPTDLMASDMGIANAPVDTSAVSDMLDYGKDQGVQTAAYQPSNIMSDSDVGDIGLRSLVTNQQGGTSGTADDLGIASLTDRNLTETTKPDLEALTKGSATYSALTDADPTKTIGTSILDDKSDDVRGGIQSGALYSGAENEFGASDTLTAKYLNEPNNEEKVAEDVGLTSRTGTGNDTQTYAEPRPTDEILRDTGTSADADRLDQFLSPLRTEKTTLPVSQEPARVTPTLGNNMEDYEDFDWDAWDRAAAEYQQQYDDQRNLADMDVSGGNAGAVETLRTPDGVDESFLDRLSPEERERYLAMQDPAYVNPLEGLAPQDLGISPENMNSFNENFNPAGGFTSGWQTVGTDRIFINDDGTGIGMNENGESYALSPEEVSSMIKNGLLNTAASGYVAATGGTGNIPGGSGPVKPTGTPPKTPPGTPPKTPPSGTDKLATAITSALTNPKTAALLAGAAVGAASGAKGIDPRGLRSIATGTGAQRVQTGAKGTGGKGGVRYFERKAAGGAISGYAGGGGLGYLKSAHDGMEDKINATIDNKRPAKLSGGEFVVPADVVSHLGNGNSEAGAKQLYALMERVRKARTGTAQQGKQINPKKYLPK